MTEDTCEHPLLIASEIGPDSKCAQCGELLLTLDQAVIYANRELN